ncbi:hypothetical protein LMJ53_16805 [Rheinheimera sp. UJ51]|uniref:hypothetical protein n=1 Tax=Rheinheimera sp. UJ51 TaxID=2892446 RepID=UPI001E3D2F1F|nr:hypothetical protein [Rheinheimera sp. UJ51]MCC5453377.1 hypothetical protein [Rheinheimera sp. UJ51]
MQSFGSEAITHNSVSNYRNTMRASVPINREGLFISLDEAASQLGLDEACILAMVKKGLLTLCNVGENLVFYRSQFKLLLEQFLKDETTVLDSYSPPQSILVSDCVFRFVRPPVPVSSGQAFRCDPASMI